MGKQEVRKFIIDSVINEFADWLDKNGHSPMNSVERATLAMFIEWDFTRGREKESTLNRRCPMAYK